MTQSEKRLTDYAELVNEFLSSKYAPTVKKALQTEVEKQTAEIIAEFEKKKRKDGRKKKTKSEPKIKMSEAIMEAADKIERKRGRQSSTTDGPNEN